MQPAARIASQIELLEQIEASIADGGSPADVLVGNYFRARRFAGSKDRRAITEAVYAVLRQRELMIWCAKELGFDPTARVLVITHRALNDTAGLELFADDGVYAPEGLSADETKYIQALKEVDVSRAPVAVQNNVPTWAFSGFAARYGDDWPKAAAELNCQAPVDLRLNKLRSKNATRESFHSASSGFENTKLSPLGLRSLKNVALGSIDDYKRGLLEVQDEAAQVASLLVDAKPGMQVVDMCAGAGGKSLTIAAQMANKGQLYAFDLSAKRLEACKKRAQRAGTRNIQVAQLAEHGSERIEALSLHKGQCDRVFVDVPCSGTGTWRRSPDQRWRQNAKVAEELSTLQGKLLLEASNLVSKAGRLLYMTCSVLPAENEDVVTAFLEAQQGWKLLDYRDVWASAIGTEVPETLSSLNEALQLSPERHQADGFFVAVLERQ